MAAGDDFGDFETERIKELFQKRAFPASKKHDIPQKGGTEQSKVATQLAIVLQRTGKPRAREFGRIPGAGYTGG